MTAATVGSESPATNLAMRQAVAEAVVGAIDWVAEDQGYVECPGQHLHTGRAGRRDCAVFLSGAPTITCVHTSCAAVVSDANKRMRSEIGKAERSASWRPNPLKLARNRRIAEERRAAAAAKSGLLKAAQRTRATILRNFAWSEVDAWEASPMRLDGRPTDDHRLFLRIFPADAMVWIGERHQSGKPEHADNFQPARQWCESPTPPGPLVCPAIFKRGSVSRSADNLAATPFLVVEGDAIDPDLQEKCAKATRIKQDIAAGLLSADEGSTLLQQYELTDEDRNRNREGCLAMIRWIAEGCGLTLRAVVDAGNKSCHGWFDRPSDEFINELVAMAAGLGLDPATFRPTQPARLPGWKRETGRFQRLLYLNWEGNK